MEVSKRPTLGPQVVVTLDDFRKTCSNCYATVGDLRRQFLSICRFAKSWQEKGCSIQAETWQGNNILMEVFG